MTSNHFRIRPKLVGSKVYTNSFSHTHMHTHSHAGLGCHLNWFGYGLRLGISKALAVLSQMSFLLCGTDKQFNNFIIPFHSERVLWLQGIINTGNARSFVHGWEINRSTGFHLLCLRALALGTPSSCCCCCSFFFVPCRQSKLCDVQNQ